MRTIYKTIITLLIIQTSGLTRANDINWSLEQLMHSLAKVETLEAHFEETKNFAIFSKLVKVKGILTYHQPNYLAREVLSPHQELTEIEDDIIRIKRKHSNGDNERTAEQQLSIDIHPAIRTLIESIRATFSGDLALLRKHYLIDFNGDQADWNLMLIPADEKIKEHVLKVNILGSYNELKKIITLEADDSTSEIIITQTKFG